MKKRKSGETFPADFKNNPFKSIKPLVPSYAAAGAKATPSRQQRKIVNKPEDDASLFLSAVEGTRRIGQSQDPLQTAAKQKKSEKKVHEELEDKQLFLSAMQKIGTHFNDAMLKPDREETEQRSATSRMRQLKRGTIHIARELDLHGSLRDEALKRLSNFVVTAVNEGQKAVLVITGKGLNSPDGPVLQGAVDGWLRSEGRGMVAEYSPAPRALGGKGAFVVFLKKRCDQQDGSGAERT